MSVKPGLAGTTRDLSAAQRALLDERLQQARRTSMRPVESRLSIPRRSAGAVVPLSFGQERLWFLDQLEPGTPVYNLCHAVRLKGALDLTALERALNVVVARHESLRTCFRAEDGHPLQVVVPAQTLELVVADLPDGNDEARAAAVRQRLQDEARRPFDLATDLLIRALVVRVTPREHVLLLTMHHIISDGWSLGVLFRELAQSYAAIRRGETPALAELPVQFADFALWERQQLQGTTFDQAMAFWKKELGGALPTLELPFDRPRASGVARGALRSMALPPAVTDAIKALGQQEGATLFMTLLAAFKVLLYRWTGADDIVVGSVVAGRRKVELEKLIGFFVNTIVVRGNLQGDPTFRTVLRRVRDFSFAAMTHQDLPFDVLVKELRPDRAVSRNPLFQVMFVVQNAPSAATELPELAVDLVDVETETAKFDLTLSMIEAPEGWRAGFEYNADLFDAATIDRLLDGYARLLAGGVSRPDRPIAELPWVDPVEQQRILTEWNETARDFPRGRTIAEIFEAQVAKAPERVALSFTGATLTYQELNDRANQLARHLQAAGVGPDRLVALCLDRSPEMLVALLAILKAGGAYVSLDTSYPPDRLAFMLADAQASVVLTHSKLRERIPVSAAGETPAFRIIELDTEAATIARQATANLAATAGASNLAYVCYTSGSTGRPKGVCVTHRGVLRLVLNPDYIEVGPDDVFTQISNSAFDASTFEIWGSLLHGARLVIIPPTTLLSPSELQACVEREKVTVMLVTTAVFNQQVEFRPDCFRSLRVVLFGGESANAGSVRAVLQGGPPRHLVHVYGPTETTTLATAYEVRELAADAVTVPIGRPIANTTAYVLDPRGQPVPIGVAGELYVGGVGVARGYLRRPELTAERFVPDPFQPGPDARLYRTGDRVRWRADGNLEFMGRFDRQVKIRGFRLELGEIETVLERHPSVKQAVVEVRDGDLAERRLIAYVATDDPALGSTELRQYLQSRMAEYMIPAGWVILETLPLNANGKVDRAALPAPQTANRSEHVAARDETERQLVEIWTAVLGVERVGVRDRFFDLGGHSLLAVRMIARLEKVFGRKLPVAAIFQHGTIEELATLLRSETVEYASATAVVEIQAQGERPPLFLVHGVGGGMFWGYANLARHLGAEQPLLAFKSRGLDGLPEYPTIEELAGQYVADLRSRQKVGPYRLGGYCFGGLVAYEMARQLEAAGEQVATLALINCSPPNTDYDRIPERPSLAWRMKFLRNLGYWLGCFAFRWTMAERVEFARWKWRVLRKRMPGRSSPEAEAIEITDLDEMVNLDAYSEDQRRLWQTHVQALRQYQPKPYGGRVTLLRTRGHALRCSFEEHYGWGPLARGGVEVVIVPGGHGNILDEPHVRKVARALERELARGSAGTTDLRAVAPLVQEARA